MTEITDYITNDYKAIDSKLTIANLLDFFVDVPFSHFPIVQEGIYIGCIASDDIDTFDIDKKIEDYNYTLEGFFARNNMIWLDVLEVFAKNNTNLIPVLDETNKYLGYYEITDILNFFHETPFLKEAGGIIIIKKRILDYSMGEIQEVWQSENILLEKLKNFFFNVLLSSTVFIKNHS